MTNRCSYVYCPSNSFQPSWCLVLGFVIELMFYLLTALGLRSAMRNRRALAQITRTARHESLLIVN